MNSHAKLGLGALVLVLLAVVCWRLLDPLDLSGPPERPGRTVEALENLPTRSEPKADASPASEPRPSLPCESSRARASAQGSLLVRVVFGEDRSPAAGVAVRVLPLDGGDRMLRRVETVTGSDGEIRIAPIAVGRVKVLLDRGGDAREARILDGEESRLDIDLPPGVDARGVVVDSRGSPVGGAEVWIYRGGSGFACGLLACAASADGTFRVRSLSRTAWVGARAPGHAPSLLHALARSDLDPTSLRLALAGGGSEIDGRVLDQRGRAVCGATVVIGIGLSDSPGLVDGSRPAANPEMALMTDASGRFRASGVKPGTIPLAARAPGTATWRGSVQAEIDAVASVEIVLEPGAALSGTATGADGLPAADVDVRVDFRDAFEEFRTTTAADGTYRFEGLGLGLLFARATARNGTRARNNVDSAPGEEIRWDITLTRGLSITGRLVDESRALLREWTVRASRSDGAERRLSGTVDVGFARTDNEGRFVIHRCEDRAHRLEFSAAGDSWRIASFSMERVYPGPEEVLIVVPDENMPTCFITGRILDPTGRAVEGAEILASEEDAAGQIFLRTEESGRFTIGPLPAARYGVTVRVESFPQIDFGKRRLERGETWDLGDVRLEMPGVLVVAVRDERGGAGTNRPEVSDATRARLGAIGYVGENSAHPQVVAGGPAMGIAADSAATVADMEGRRLQPLHPSGDVWRSDPLAAGRYHLLVDGMGVAAATVPFDVRSGEETRLDVDVRLGTRRTLRLVDVSGVESASKARVVLRGVEGRVVTDRLVLRLENEPLSFTVWLGPGSYTLEATTETGARATGSFAVEDLSGSDAPIEFSLR